MQWHEIPVTLDTPDGTITVPPGTTRFRAFAASGLREWQPCPELPGALALGEATMEVTGTLTPEQAALLEWLFPSPEPPVAEEQAPVPGESAEPRTVAELRQALAEANAKLSYMASRVHATELREVKREDAVKALAALLDTFPQDHEGHWTQSAYVSPQDLDGWRHAEHRARSAA